MKITYTHLRKRSLRKLLDKLNEKAQDAILVVEGKQDASALAPIIDADFFLLQDDRKSLYEIAEQIAAMNKKAILLLDVDPKGRELTKKMTSYLQQYGVSVDSKIGLKLLKIANCDTIQGLRRVIKEIVLETQ